MAVSWCPGTETGPGSGTQVPRQELGPGRWGRGSGAGGARGRGTFHPEGKPAHVLWIGGKQRENSLEQEPRVALLGQD